MPLINSIDEDASCNYELRLNSKYACPVQCPRGANGRVCSGRGVCLFGGYGDDDSSLEGTASAACACRMGNFGQPHTGLDCGTYSRWGTTYTDNYNCSSHHSSMCFALSL